MILSKAAALHGVCFLTFGLSLIASRLFLCANLNVLLPVQVLTLANGDRILMTPQMKAMFETENLNNASPATVSRAGIIYVSRSELGWSPIVASWLQKRTPAEADALKPLFDAFVDPLLDFVRCVCFRWPVQMSFSAGNFHHVNKGLICCDFYGLPA